MKEPRVSSDLADNIGNPFAPMVYSISTLHCLTVSLAHGGTGLGTAWGEQVARRMVAEADFRDIQVYDTPGDPIDAIFVSSKPDRSLRLIGCRLNPRATAVAGPVADTPDGPCRHVSSAVAGCVHRCRKE